MGNFSTHEVLIMPYKVVLLRCKIRGDTFEPKEDQASVYPLKIASCPKCGQAHTYTREEASEVIFRDFESDRLVEK